MQAIFNLVQALMKAEGFIDIEDEGGSGTEEDAE